MKLTDLDPHFLKPVSPVDYEQTDDITLATALQLRCPACHWAGQRTGDGEAAHTIMLWGDPAHWRFAGHGYRDLSMLAGRRTPVGITAGGCHSGFQIKAGNVRFY